ncbi:hypothetical protein Lal_00039271 [Lupinus albus]|nr:hypothetical protein Lal_00039271 [Lupinus albus]
MVVLNKFLETLDSQFFYAFDIDEDNVCHTIFWVDGRARNANLKFCDVIVFDVTYKTNSFSMSFVPFIGENHHRQSTLFGCALLVDEREETFVWLFNQWLRCMWNKASGALIIDQDVAIGNAIKRGFPHAHHRYCSWHLSLHEYEHIRSLHSKPEFDGLYTRWTKKRMKSSQRSESMIAFFDGFVHSTTPLNEFDDQYDKAFADRRSKEETKDLFNMRTHPYLTYLSPIECHSLSMSGVMNIKN